MMQSRRQLAIAKAVRDSNLERDVREHGQHLAEVNGSQREMAASLSQLVVAGDKQAAVTAGIAAHVKEQAAGQLSRRTLQYAAAVAIAAWVTIIVVIVLSVGF